MFKFKNGKLHLESIHPTSSLEEAQENTGLDLIHNEVKYTAFPTEQELAALKKIDPFDYRSIEF